MLIILSLREYFYKIFVNKKKKCLFFTPVLCYY